MSNRKSLLTRATGLVSFLKSGKHKPSAESAVSTQRAHALAGKLQPESSNDENTPTYPPFQHGIPASSVTALMKTQHRLISQIKEQLGLDDYGWYRVVLPMLTRYAEIVHLLPASETHHHRGAGGLLRHGLEAGFWACRSAENKIFTQARTPRGRRNESKLWEVAALTGGLAHDVGKPIADVSVTDMMGHKMWNPHIPLARWLNDEEIDRYYLYWNSSREHKQHESFSVLFLAEIIDGDTKQYLLTQPEVMDQLLQTVSGKGENTEFGQLILWADRESVSRDLKNQRFQQDEFAYGVPVEKYYFDALRSLVEQKDIVANKPPYNLCVTDDGVYLKWKELLPAVLRYLSEQNTNGVRGVPSNPDVAARLLIERGLASGRPAPSDAAKDAYYLYHKLLPARSAEEGMYLLIHDPDMLFPSTVLPSMMEVELVSLEGTKQELITTPASDEDSSDDTQQEEMGELEGASSEGEQDSEPVAQEGGKASESDARPDKPQPIITRHEACGDGVEFETPASDGDVATDPAEDPAEDPIAFLNSGGETVASDASANDEAQKDEPTSVPEEAATGGEGADEPLHFLEFGDQGDEREAQSKEGDSSLLGAESSEESASRPSASVPSFLVGGNHESAITPKDDADDIEYDDAVTQDSEQKNAASTDADEDAADADTHADAADADTHADAADTDTVASAAAPSAPSSADHEDSAPEKEAPSGLAVDPSTILEYMASVDATPEGLIYASNPSHQRKQQLQERFERRAARRLEKANRSTSDQTDVDAELRAKREKTSDPNGLGAPKTASGKPGLVAFSEDEGNQPTNSSSINRKAVSVQRSGWKSPASISVTKKKPITIAAKKARSITTTPKKPVTIAAKRGASDEKAPKPRHSLAAPGRNWSIPEPVQPNPKPRNTKAGVKPKRLLAAQAAKHASFNEADSPVSREAGAQEALSLDISIEPQEDNPPSKEQIVAAYQIFQQEVLERTHQHHPNIDTALILDSIVYSVVMREKPLGHSAFYNSKHQLLIRYPEGIQEHLPGRPIYTDSARIAGDMFTSRLVSHLSGTSNQPQAVHRDPETGVSVLCVAPGVSNKVNRLVTLVAQAVEFGGDLPTLSRLTHRNKAKFEAARKELQSSIAVQTLASNPVAPKPEPAPTAIEEEVAGGAETPAAEPEPPLDRTAGQLEKMVSAKIKPRRSDYANGRVASRAIVEVIASQIKAKQGTLIEDAPETSRDGVISVQQSIITRAEKAANHGLVTGALLRRTIREFTGGATSQGKSEGISKIELSKGRLYLHLREGE